MQSVGDAWGHGGRGHREREVDDEVDLDLEVARPTLISSSFEGDDVSFEIDREVTARLYASHAGGVDAFRAVGHTAQDFLERAVLYLADDVGLRQFLVMGPSISGRENVHEIAQAIAPETRVVYVLFDPVMLVYAHRLARDATPGTTSHFKARMRDVDKILREASATLDLAQPVAVLLPGNLSFVRRPATAKAIVDGLMDPLVPGSHLVLSHYASDLLADQVAGVYASIAELATEGRSWEIVPRSHDEVTAFFAGLELVEPGVVPIERWHAGAPTSRSEPQPVQAAIHGGIGRKPGRT